jgi:hypothetical protein
MCYQFGLLSATHTPIPDPFTEFMLVLAASITSLESLGLVLPLLWISIAGYSYPLMVMYAKVAAYI